MPEIADEEDVGPETPAQRDERRGVDRLEAFSDGVFAIAITLLVLGIEVPEVGRPDLNDAIGDLVPNIVAYFIGFFVIGLFWINHHAFYGRVERHDARLLWSNLIFLSLVSMMPFTTGLIGEYSGERDSVILFATNVALAGLAVTWSEWGAVRSGLLGEGDPAYVRFPRWESFITPAVFLLSIPIAFVSAEAAQYFWLTSLVASRFYPDD